MEKREDQTKKRRSHKWLWGVAIIAGGCLLLFLLLPTLLSTTGGTSFVENRLSSAVDGTVTMGDLSIGWFNPLQVSDFLFESPEKGTRVQVDKITSRPQYLSLISGRLALKDTVIERPDVQLTVTEEGRIKGLPDVLEPEEKPKKEPMQVGRLDLKVNDGRALIRQETSGSGYRQVEFRNIASNVNLQPSGASNLSLSMGVAQNGQGGTIQAGGEMESKGEGFSLEGLSGRFEVEVDSLDLESLAPLLAIAGVTVEDLGGTVNATATLDMADGDLETLIADARVENFRQTVGGETINLQEPITAQARIITQDGNYQIEQLQIQSTFLTLDGTGGVNQFDYTVQADLAQTQAVVGPLVGLEGYDVQGRLNGSGTVRFQEEQIRSTGQMQVDQFVLVHDQNELGPTPLELQYEVAVAPDRQQAQIAGATVQFTPGQLRLSDGSVNWSGEQTQANLQIGGQINLQQARPYVNFFYALPEDVTIAGTAQPDLRVQMDGPRLAIDAGNTRVENLRVSQPDKKPFVSRQVTVNGQAVLDLENNALEELSDFSVTSDHIRIRYNQQSEDQPGEQTKVMGRIEADYDLEAVGGLIGPFMPGQLELSGRRQDFFDFTSVYPRGEPDKLLANLNGTGKFGFAAADYLGMHFGQADLNLVARNGVLSLNLPPVPVNNGTVQFKGSIDLGADPMFLKLEEAMPIVSNVQLNDVISNQLLRYVNPVFVNSVDVTGLANLTCQVLELPLGGASMEEMQIEGTLWAENINMQASSFWGTLLQAARSPMATINLRQTHFVVQNGVLHYERMPLEVGDRPFVFGGDIGITTDEFDMSVQLPVTIRGETIKVGEQEEGRPLVAGITGTARGLKLDLQRTIEGGVEEMIRGELERLFDRNRR